MGVIGAADEFWRIRLTRVDTTEDLDFEWHEDILYREPVVGSAREVELFNVEAVDLSDSEHVVLLGSFEQREEAQRLYDEARENLAEMTRSQFEDAYFDDSEDDAAAE